ncbi:MICOS complex subunit MIC27-like [Lineus longissimus]|uniref:MICOS complex subunit MIC27-like n=1 Tax=Lineus longissimus TaxID=88925 RepID=UPI002B4E6E8B
MAGKKFLGLAGSLGSVPIIMYKVHAAEAEKKLVKPSELPLYENPHKRVVEFVLDEPNTYTSTISTVRQQTCKVMTSLKDTSDILAEKYGIAKAHTLDLVNYIQDDPGYIPRAAVITVAGLGGIIVGYKRGVLRKAFYAVFGMTAAGALCYPNQALDISQQAYTRVKQQAQDLWEQKPSSKKKKLAKTTQVVETKKDEKPVDSSLVDMGQSKPEDKDMYSTRS